MTKIQKVTFWLMALYLVWEGFVQYWAKDETTAVIRVDLILIYPVLLVLVFISVWQYFSK